MNEMDLLTRLRDEVPQTASPRAEYLFRAGLDDNDESERAGGARSGQPLARCGFRALRPAWRLAIIAPLVAGLAAAAVVAALPARNPSLTVRLLADRAAAAARSAPAVSPGQWVYRKWVGPGPNLRLHVTYDLWSTADDITHAAYIGGTLYFISNPGSGGPVSRHIPSASGRSGLTGFIVEPVSYSSLGSLPTDPSGLVTVLGHSIWGCGFRQTTPACHAFHAISALLWGYVMPPALTAECYQALADIPGVTVVQNVVDEAGQASVGFRLAIVTDYVPGTATGHVTGYAELILNPRTYQVIGWQGVLNGQAWASVVLQQALVSGPGVRP
jgi:hypothetical protein